MFLVETDDAVKFCFCPLICCTCCTSTDFCPFLYVYLNTFLTDDLHFQGWLKLYLLYRETKTIPGDMQLLYILYLYK